MNAIGIFFCALTLCFVTGCATSQPVLNVTNSPIPYNLSQQAVAQAIINAGARKSWIMNEQSPGLIIGNVHVRHHRADIRIPYDMHSYSINYVSSVNLNDKGRGSIHRSYNRWIKGLNQEIQLEMNRVSSYK